MRKRDVKDSITKFLGANPKSRNGAIWKLVQTNKKTRVSLKVFNNYLQELVNENIVEKSKGDKSGHKYPRYSLTTEDEREIIQVAHDEQWIENIRTIIVELERDATKIDPNRLVDRIYYVYSMLIGLLQKQKILQEFANRKFLTSQTSHKSVANFKRVIPALIDNLFVILDKLPAKLQRQALSSMIIMSENEYEETLESVMKYGPEEAFTYIPVKIRRGQKLHIDNFWAGWPDEYNMTKTDKEIRKWSSLPRSEKRYWKEQEKGKKSR